MTPEDPIDDVLGSISDGTPVEWEGTESLGEDSTSRRTLQDLERLADYHRGLQRSTNRRSDPTGGAAPTDATSDEPKVEHWGHLVILELASAGASGEVWRAWDPWLQREVALKFLRPSSRAGLVDVSDSELLEEARALARVRHPSVVAVYGIAEHGGRTGMWMELLQGTTLAEEIDRRGPLPGPEVARLGMDLCRALAAVEAAGLVHRDIKPTNIILEPSGRVVLTDFGLGRRRAFTESKPWRSSGTPLFMAPEILDGDPATARSDLYALGVTLRWAICGRAPFRAQSLAELKEEVRSGSALPLDDARRTAPTLADAIDRAMAPQAALRFGNALEMATAIESGNRPPWWGRKWPARATIIVAGLALVLGAVLGGARKASDISPNPLVRFKVYAPPQTVLRSSFVNVSPDGRLLAFVAIDSLGVPHAWVRPLDAHEPRLLPGTQGTEALFWSPDSRHLGFFAQQKMKRIAISGGDPEILCSSRDHRGATWGRGTIVFASAAVGPLCRVADTGGPVTIIQRPDSTRNETTLRWPVFLPDGRHYMFVALPPRDGGFDVFVGTLDSNERTHLMVAGSAPLYAGPEGLVFASSGRLFLQPFDVERLRTIGDPKPLGPAPSHDVSVGMPLVSVSTNGVMAWTTSHLANTEIVWLDRRGVRQGVVPAPPGRYESIYLLPDGRRALSELRTSQNALELWLVELANGKATRFVQGTQTRLGGRPAWSPDGTRVAFSSNRQGTTNIYTRSTTGTADEELLYESSGQFKEVNAWSSDGRYLVFEQADPVTGWDLWLLPLDGDRKPVPYLNSRFNEVAASISPDGRWLAYCSDATGRAEIYVRSFPTPGTEHIVSTQGGHLATWSLDGKEILVYSPVGDHSVWSVPVRAKGSTFEAAPPTFLFRSPIHELWLTPAADGNRFLSMVPAEGHVPTSIVVDLNWPVLLGL